MNNEKFDLYEELKNLKLKVEAKMRKKCDDVIHSKPSETRTNIFKRWIIDWFD